MLDAIDLSLKLGRKDYEHAMQEQQLKLARLRQRMWKSGIPMIVLYEGWDASGKGGSIVRITEKLDPRGLQVWPIGAPTETELQYHYLWRFWTRIPYAGQLTIFDRSWYGRVLVERVEKLATPEEWQRAYQEIRAFERMLVDDGMLLVKFWMHISKDEQLRRFKEREANPFKQWKIGPDDWRNRERWDDYLRAAEDMLRETYTTFAPWTLVPSECKLYARVTTIRTVVERLEATLGD